MSRRQQNTAGPIKRPSSSTNTLLRNITGSIASCYKSHRHSICLHATAKQRGFIHDYNVSFQHSSILSSKTSLQLSSVTSSISGDPLTQFTAKPSFVMQAIAWGQCKQAREAIYKCQRLKAIYIYYITICVPACSYFHIGLQFKVGDHTTLQQFIIYYIHLYSCAPLYGRSKMIIIIK